MAFSTVKIRFKADTAEILTNISHKISRLPWSDPKVLLVMLVSASFVQAGEYQQSYEVTGTTARELVESINQHSQSPDGAFGYTKLNTHLSWTSVVDTDGVCSIDAAEFTYDITIYMPDWVEQHNAKPCLRENWAIVWNNIQLHEEHHRDLYRLIDAQAINQKIMALQPHRSCPALKRSVNQIVEQALNTNNRLHDEFHAVDIPPTLRGC